MTDPEIAFPASTVGFDSITELLLYLKKLLYAYELQVATYGEKVSILMRDAFNRDKLNKRNMKKIYRNWEPLGPIFINEVDSLSGEVEATFELLTEFKHKVLVTKGVLVAVDKSIKEEEEHIPSGPMTLYLSYGVPKMLVVKNRVGPH